MFDFDGCLQAPSSDSHFDLARLVRVAPDI